MQQPRFNPDFGFLEKVEAAGPFNVSECYQCRKCTNGCPATFEMDFFPDQVIRMASLGVKDKVLRSKTIWICASCETCSTRCPNGVRIAELMDYLKELAIREGISAAQPQVAALHQTFLNNVRRTGRIFEGGLLPAYWLKSGQVGSKLASGDLKHDLKLAFKLFRRGRLPLMPKGIMGKAEVRAIFSSYKQTGTGS